jgi:hypothetical protein
MSKITPARTFTAAAGAPAAAAATLPVCHIFVDASNVNVTDANIPGLSAIAHRGFGAVHTAVVIGTTPGPSNKEALWKNLGYNAEFTVRPPGTPESVFNVDATLVAWIYRTKDNYRFQKSTIVLVTGDGNNNDGKPNFREVVQTLLEQDWNVKLVCLRPNPVYCTMQRQFPKSMEILRVNVPMIAAENCSSDAVVGRPQVKEAPVAPARPTGTARQLPQPVHGFKPAPLPLPPLPLPPLPSVVAVSSAAQPVGGHAKLEPQKLPRSQSKVVARQTAAPPTEASQVVARQTAAPPTEASRADLLLKIVEQAIASGCTSFTASVGPSSASFTTR